MSVTTSLHFVLLSVPRRPAEFQPGVQLTDFQKERGKHGTLVRGMFDGIRGIGARLLGLGKRMFQFPPFLRQSFGIFRFGIQRLRRAQNLRDGIVLPLDGLNGLFPRFDCRLKLLHPLFLEKLNSVGFPLQVLQFALVSSGQFADLHGNLPVDFSPGNLLQNRGPFVGRGLQKRGELSLRQNHRAGKMSEIHPGQLADKRIGLFEFGR